MSITRFLKRQMKQKAVYWGNPVDDGYGKYTYDPPIELDVRWEKGSELVLTGETQEAVITAEVYTDHEVVEQGMIFLGGMDDEKYDPDVTEVDSANRILYVKEIPALGKRDEFVRVARVNLGAGARI